MNVMGLPPDGSGARNEPDPSRSSKPSGSSKIEALDELRHPLRPGRALDSLDGVAGFDFARLRDGQVEPDPRAGEKRLQKTRAAGAQADLEAGHPRFRDPHER